MSKFKFELGDHIQIAVSGEAGVVIGRAEYLSGEVSYLIHYKAADGRAVSAWWNEPQVSAS